MSEKEGCGECGRSFRQEEKEVRADEVSEEPVFGKGTSGRSVRPMESPADGVSVAGVSTDRTGGTRVGAGVSVAVGYGFASGSGVWSRIEQSGDRTVRRKVCPGTGAAEEGSGVVCLVRKLVVVVYSSKFQSPYLLL